MNTRTEQTELFNAAQQMLRLVEKHGIGNSDNESEPVVNALRRAVERAEVVSDGYTRGQLETAFNAVANSENWKKPINAVIPKGDMAVTKTAVVFYAGCVPVFTGIKAKAGYVRCTAVGYYVAVGV